MKGRPEKTLLFAPEGTPSLPSSPTPFAKMQRVRDARQMDAEQSKAQPLRHVRAGSGWEASGISGETFPPALGTTQTVHRGGKNKGRFRTTEPAVLVCMKMSTHGRTFQKNQDLCLQAGSISTDKEKQIRIRIKAQPFKLYEAFLSERCPGLSRGLAHICCDLILALLLFLFFLPPNIYVPVAHVRRGFARLPGQSPRETARARL